MFRCNECNLNVNSINQLEEHRRGKKHTFKSESGNDGHCTFVSLSINQTHCGLLLLLLWITVIAYFYLMISFTEYLKRTFI